MRGSPVFLILLVLLGPRAVRADDLLSESWWRTRPEVTSHLNSVTWTGTHFVAVGSAVMTSLDGRHWIRRGSPNPHTWLQAVTAHGKDVTACGTHGRVWCSRDGGITWSASESGLEGTLYAVADNGSVLMVAGTRGELVVSNDRGATWERKDAGTTKTVRDILWTGAEFVALADGWTIHRSDDGGQSWSAVPSPPWGLSREPHSVIRAPDGSLLAVGEGGRLLSSSDGGRNWAESSALLPSSPSGVTGIGATDDQIVVFFRNDWIYSADGLDSPWTLRSQGQAEIVNDTVQVGDRVIAVGNGPLVLEYDLTTHVLSELSAEPRHSFLEATQAHGRTWTLAADGNVLVSEDEGRTWQNKKWADSLFLSSITATDDGILLTTSDGFYRGTPEGDSWELLKVDDRWSCRSVARLGSTFLAGGLYSRLYRSTDDGDSWNYTEVPEGGVFQAMTVRGTRVMAASLNGTIVSSDDGGLTWTRRTSRVSTSLDWFHQVGSDVFVGGAEGVILRSVDGGDTWSGRSTGISEAVTGLCHTGTVLLASTRHPGPPSQDGVTVLRSADGGESWSTITLDTHERLEGIVWTGQSVIALGGRGAVAVSDADGLHWQTLYRSHAQQLTDVIWTGEALFAVGLDGMILESRDQGFTWVKRWGNTTDTFSALAWTGSHLLAVTSGARTQVYRSTDGINWTRRGNSAWNFANDIVATEGVALLRFAGASYLSTDDGATWTDISDDTNAPLNLDSIEWAVDRFYGIDNDHIYSSLGGVRWERGERFNGLRQIIGVNGRLVGSANRATLFESTDDGKTWTPITPGFEFLSHSFRSLAWTGEHLVAIDNNEGITILGPGPGLDYLAWAHGAGRTGMAVPPAAVGPEGLPNVGVYAFDLNGDGRLSLDERHRLPAVHLSPGTRQPVLQFALPIVPRSDLRIGIEGVDHSAPLAWSRLASRDGTGSWSGRTPPTRSEGDDTSDTFTLPLNHPEFPTRVFRMTYGLR